MSKVSEMPDGPPAADGLTNRQRMVLEYIAESVEGRGYPPSMREIGEAVGLASPSSVKHQLASLERKGFIRRDPNRPRAIEVRMPDPASSGIDVTGSGDEHATSHLRPIGWTHRSGWADPGRRGRRRCFPAPQADRGRRSALHAESRRGLNG